MMSDDFPREMSLKDTDKTTLLRSSSHKNMYFAAFSASLYIVGFGMVVGYAAPATEDMKRSGSRFKDITADEIAWIASLPSLSAIIGNIFAGYASHKFGRKAVLMYISVSFTISWLVIAYAHRLSLVLMGRLISGICAGISSVAVPAYIVEISTVQTRGLLNTSFQLSFAVGVFLEMMLGIFLRWSWLATVGAVVVVLSAYLMSIMPESPPWLMRSSRNDEAFVGLKFLRGKYSDSSKEFQEIRESMTEEPKSGLTFKELLLPEMYKPLIISILLMFFQQFAGINALMAYSVNIFQDSKSFLDPTVAATIVALVQILATILSGLLMDKKGRKILFIVSGCCMVLSLIASGVYSKLFLKIEKSHLNTWTWVPMTTFVTYIIGFSIGFGPIPFVVTPEIVPTHSRSFVLSVASVFNSCFSFIVIKTFEDLRSFLGLSGVYWFYATLIFLGVLFYWKFVPETKGRTIREIHRLFSVSKDSQ